MSRFQRIAVVALAVLVCAAPMVHASDHADPISLTNRFMQEGGITDLFVYPEMDASGNPILEQGRPKNLVVILCVRRRLAFTPALTMRPEYLTLEPYTYTIHFDLNSPVTVVPGGNPPDQFTARYGGTVPKPDGIRSTASIASHLTRPNPEGLVPGTFELQGLRVPKNRIQFYSGIRDDPFIFPPFFRSNVVAMVMRVPIEAFPSNQDTWIVWATASRNGKQVDHVGRSLRTQNPRFEMLNTLEPKDHVNAIEAEEAQPSLMRNLFLRLGLNQTFAYRPWDKAPDVMIFSLRNKDAQGNLTSFPNGRKLTDDVAKLLADWGDTLLFELSYRAPAFPRATKNDKEFLPEFPYLAAPWELPKLDDAPMPITTRNRWKLFGIFLAVLILWLGTAWFIALKLKRRWLRKRYL